MKRIHVYISGRVQGVFFRAETERKAKSLQLTGWVRNMPDRRVEAVFEGEDPAVDQMITWCHSGPPLARIDHVDVTEEPYRGNFSNFKISFL